MFSMLRCVLSISITAVFVAFGPCAAWAQERVPRTGTFPGVAGAPFPYAAPEEVGLSAEVLQSLTDRVVEWVHEDRIVGAEILIVKDRKIALHETVGWSDRDAGEPMRRNSIFRLRSMTKPFTGTAALMLVEEGKLELDAPVARYLPSWDNERSGEITVRQLLTHTGGFEQGGTPQPLRAYADLRAVVDASGEHGPQHPPGSAYRYSDVHSYTLGALVAEISGMPVERFIEERILDPVGLHDTHTRFAPDTAWAHRMNPTYRREEGEWVRYWSPEEEQAAPFFRASGGLYSTTLDYARWLAVWMDGGRIPPRASDGAGTEARLLSQATVEAALSRHFGADYGYHWSIIMEDPLVFGHGGSDGTHAMAIPSLDVMVLCFTQSRGTDTRSDWLFAALEAVAPQLEIRFALPTASPADADLEFISLGPSERARYLGRYVEGRDTFTVREANGRLKLDTGNPGWPEFDLAPLGGDGFALVHYEGSRLVEIYFPATRVRFILEGERVTRLEVVRDEEIRASATRVP